MSDRLSIVFGLLFGCTILLIPVLIMSCVDEPRGPDLCPVVAQQGVLGTKIRRCDFGEAICYTRGTGSLSCFAKVPQ